MEVTRELRVANKQGIHLRVASLIVRAVGDASSEVTLEKGSYAADCKSCLDLLALAATEGTDLTLRVHGDDAEEVAAKIELLFQTKFGEDEYASNSAE